jgi:hypothetical protein
VDAELLLEDSDDELDESDELEPPVGMLPDLPLSVL